MNRKEAITKWFAGSDFQQPVLRDFDYSVKDVELSGDQHENVGNYRITFPHEVSDWRIYFDAETGEVIEGYCYDTVMEY